MLHFTQTEADNLFKLLNSDQLENIRLGLELAQSQNIDIQYVCTQPKN
ncbi:hypothetical protein QNI22_15095 [Cytophagaceae bacterium BD1B2-1]|uniref:Uncharacterized protein n=1 Tax=Xanthocytophaga agilis TaxID=3048010 RepID=A0AAE3UG28_9BACT|nr:hypothetical protein [Xanthocytophaga agilis]